MRPCAPDPDRCVAGVAKWASSRAQANQVTIQVVFGQRTISGSAYCSHPGPCSRFCPRSRVFLVPRSRPSPCSRSNPCNRPCRTWRWRRSNQAAPPSSQSHSTRIRCHDNSRRRGRGPLLPPRRWIANRKRASADLNSAVPRMPPGNPVRISSAGVRSALAPCAAESDPRARSRPSLRPSARSEARDTDRGAPSCESSWGRGLA